MINFIKGKVININDKQATILVGGFGYSININNNSLSQLTINNEIELHTHMAIRENDISLFGFISKNDLDLFKLLISVKGVGPKSACEILNSPSNEIKTAIAQQDENALSKVPGIGKKTAKRIIVELQNKISDIEITQLRAHKGVKPEIDDAIEALINLGYQKNHITKTFQNMPGTINKAEEIIKYFLSNQ